MSAIAGVFHRDGRPIEPAGLDRMMSGSRHRAPDGSRVIVAGAVGLCHQLLLTLPEDAGVRQPIADARSGLCITFDGRIDNRDEVCAALGVGAVDGRRFPDAAIALRAVERWGTHAPARLLGDFAFAVWNSREQSLFCARDISGVRPFHYVVDDATFAFATDIGPLFHAGFAATDPNEAMVAEFLADRLQHRTDTFYRNVSRLPAAHWLLVDRGRLIVREYWTFDEAASLSYADPSGYAEHFRALFAEAVACRLRTDRSRVAVYLSGGIDSSAIVSTAAWLARDRHVPACEAFSFVFPGHPASDEREHMAAVSDRWNVASHFVEIRPQDGLVWRGWPAAARRDVPTATFEDQVAEVRSRMRESGLRVALTGRGGDHAFEGGAFEDYADLLGRGDVITLLRRNIEDARTADLEWRPSAVFTSGLVPLLSPRLRAILRPAARALGVWPVVVPDWIAPEFSRRTALDDRLREGRARARPADHSRRRTADTLRAGILQHEFEVEDWFAAGHAIEERHPFFDRRVMEFAVAIPESQRRRGRERKVVVRAGLRDLLPHSVWARSGKGDYSGQAIRTLEAVAADGIFDDLLIASLGWVRQDRVTRMWRELRQGFRSDYDTDTTFLFPLWEILSVELWCRTVLMGHAADGLQRSPSDVLMAS